MKVWHVANLIWYDAVINGVTPNFIELDTEIDSIEFDGKNAYIKGTPHDAVIHDLNNHLITTVRYKVKSAESLFHDLAPMNRIEQIRDNVKNVTDWYADNGLFVEDIEFLLSEVELLQKALSKSMSLLEQYEEILHLDTIITNTPKEPTP